MVPTHGQPFPLRPDVDQPVEVAQRGQRLALLVRRHERLGDHVLVEQRHQRHPHARQAADLGGVDAAGVDHDVGGDGTLLGAHPAHPSAIQRDAVTRAPVTIRQPARSAPPARARQRREGSM